MSLSIKYDSYYKLKFLIQIVNLKYFIQFLIAMSINFIKNAIENKADDITHHAFTRYGTGEYPKEEFKVKKSSKNIRIWAGFEYTNSLLKFVATLCDGNINVNGVIITSEDLEEVLNKNKIEFTAKEKRGMRGLKKTEYSIQGDFKKEELIKLIDQLNKYYLFIDIKQGTREYKVKKKAVPKVGKETNKFVTATIDIKDESKLREEFLFDVKDSFNEITINHTYIIEKIDVDEKMIEKDPAKARLEANLTQVEASNKLKRPQSYISKAEAGEQRLDIVEIKKFATLYKKDINYFL